MGPQEPWKKKVDLLRKRFTAREDAFCVKRTFTRSGEGGKIEETYQFGPQYIETNDDQKKYQPLNDEWLRKHIYGEKELVPYLVRPDGIKYGACDFDGGKPFDDAKLVRDFSASLGLPCYISRSSRKGYHLYWFFSEPVQPHLFTSLLHYIYDKVGFHERFQQNPAGGIPEVFPKQTKYSEGKFGNGILIPMIEPKMKEGRNCWVQDDAIPLPFEKQWEYLASCREVTPKELEEVIEANRIEILHMPTARTSGSLERAYRETRGSSEGSAPVKPRGDFWNIVGNCPAMRQFWEKDADGTYKVPPDANEKWPPHTARVASLAFARATTNGLQIIKDRWPGVRTDTEFEYSERSNQHPWTCRAMQDAGLCRVGIHPLKHDHCIKKSPPGDIVNGQFVVNPDRLPESEWKEPSPIRFATGYMPLEQILTGLTDLFDFRGKKIKDPAGTEHPAPQPSELDAQFYDYLKKGRKLAPDEQKKLQDFVTANKFLPSKELKALEKRLIQEVKAEAYEERKEDIPNFTFHGNDYFLENGTYIKGYLGPKGEPKRVELTNFTVDITEEIVLIHNLDDEDHKNEKSKEHRWFKGVINLGSKHFHFKIPSSEWIRSGETFFSFLSNRAGSGLKYVKADYDDIRNCIGHFSDTTKVIRKKVEDFGHYKIRGEHTYITPSVVVTKDQIQPNHELELEYNDELSKPLDFKIIDEQQFKDLALHIINDYFECNSATATMTTFAHAMAASVMSHIPLNKSPVLWINGSYSSGKSFIAEIAQFFYGNFSYLAGMNTTGKGKLLVAHNFRNALFVIDDFKSALSEHNTREMIQLIHTAYDRSGRTASKQTGELRESATRIRGLIATTGEDYPSHEASAISRMLIVHVGSSGKDVVKGERVKERKKDYCGFTPYFVQFVYNMDKSDIQEIYREYLTLFEKKGVESGSVESSYRISENLAFNMTAFRLSMDLLHARGVIPVQRHVELCARHVKNLEIIRATIVSGAGSQKGAAVFLDTLKELLQDPAHFHITNYGNFDPTEHRNSKSLGFFRSAEPGVVFLYPQSALSEVEVLLKKTKNYSQTRQHIARQLVEDGHIPADMFDAKSASFTKQVTTPIGNRAYCWVIKVESLGFPTPKPVAPSSPSEQPLAEAPHINVVNFAVNE